MKGNSEKIKSEILKLLDEHSEGLIIQDISSKLKVHRHTAARYISFLEGAQEVVVRKIGVISLVYKKEALRT